MKTKTLLSVLVSGLFMSSFCQQSSIELSFTAKNMGQTVALDSIIIENLSQGGDTTLYAPDTILVLDFGTSINDNQKIAGNFLTVSQNYPNPFNAKTEVNLYLPEKEYVIICVRDIVGKELAQYENTLNSGNHTFTFYSGNEKYYLLSVLGKHTQKTIKMLNANSNSVTGHGCKIVHSKYENDITIYKFQHHRRVAPALAEKAIKGFVFAPGDQLRFTGFASTSNEIPGNDEIEDAPLADQIYEFNIIEGMRCPGTPTVLYENQIYNTVKIGSQCWLKENLNVGTMINGSEDMAENGMIEKYCYNNNSSNCSNYGGLYQWGEVMQYDTAQGAQGICPPGWHIPTDEEWKQLEGVVDSQYDYPDPVWDEVGMRGFDAGLNLKSASGWSSGGNGTDEFGFSARAGGWRTFNGDFSDIGYVGHFWTSTEYYTNTIWRRGFSYYFESSGRGADDTVTGFAARCLKD